MNISEHFSLAAPARAARPESTVKSHGLLFGLAFALLITIATTAFWYHAAGLMAGAHSRSLLGTLQPIAELLKEDDALLHELRSASFSEMDSTILDSYLIKIRRDGVAKHADMKQRLDTLAENNAAIVTLIKVYGPQAKMPGFNHEADEFRNYASAWRDRWNSVMELFMAGGSYAVSEVPFPRDFQATVDAEIAVTE